jgi:hypothetical protein
MPERDPEEIVAVWVEGPDCTGPALYSRLRDVPSVACVLLGHAPSSTPAQPNNDPLNTLLAAGIPVAMWHRRRSESLAQGLNALVHGTTLGSLPERVWDERKRALQTGDLDHSGRHLTLLWDDPTRTSPDFDPAQQLRAPQ